MLGIEMAERVKVCGGRLGTLPEAAPDGSIDHHVVGRAHEAADHGAGRGTAGRAEQSLLHLKEVGDPALQRHRETGIAGLGRGVSRPNVNEFFSDRVTHTVTLQFPGFGASVRVTEHLSAFADLRFMFQSRSGEPDAGGFGPVRGGLAWRF